MKKAIFTAVIIIITSIPGWTSGWDTAVSIYSMNAELKPYRMDVSSTTYNGRGKLEKTEIQSFRLSYDTEGEMIQELIKAVEDGKDITEKKRRELEKNAGKSDGPPGDSEDFEGMDKLPLDPEVQKDLKAIDTGRKAYKNSTLCSVWDFTIQLNDKYSGVGTAWLSTQTGEAVSMEYEIEPLFPFVEEMKISMDFTTDSSNRWILEKLKMNGRINMIIMKKSFDSVTSFSDYR